MILTDRTFSFFLLYFNHHQDYIAKGWDGVSAVLRREEKRGDKIIKALARAEQKALEKETKPHLKVDKFTKQMHHKRQRQMAKLQINEELRRICG